ncbi:MAG TPA: hypothetical protein VIC57_16645 [Candidatus Dormibacteraeota bacterium]|jgi:hypothetical protein
MATPLTSTTARCPACPADDILSEDLADHLRGFHGWSEARIAAHAAGTVFTTADHLADAVRRLEEAAQEIEDALGAAYDVLEEFGCEERIPAEAHRGARQVVGFLRDHARTMVEEAAAEETG